MDPGLRDLRAQACVLGERRRLFAVYHPAQTALSAQRAVLLCNPFGHEALRTHRLYRVLAERLARRGTPVMRFDYFGTGDAAGEDIDVDMAGCIEDVLSMHSALLRRSGAASARWVGIRLGASIACLAARQGPAQLSALTLVDPVVDGPRYLELLDAVHVDRLERAFVRQPTLLRRLLKRPLPEAMRESGGFALAPAFIAQAGAITPYLIRDPLPCPAHILHGRHDDALGALHAELGRAAGGPLWEALEGGGFAWSAHEGVDGTLLPPLVLKQLLKALEPSNE